MALFESYERREIADSSLFSTEYGINSIEECC